MSKKVLTFIGIFIITIFVIYFIYNRIYETKMEAEYQEGIRRISEGKYRDAGARLYYPYKGDYKSATILFYYAAAMDSDSHMRRNYFEKIPDSYNGPLAEKILASKKEELHAIKIKEDLDAADLKRRAEAAAMSRERVLSDREEKGKNDIRELESILEEVKHGDLYIAEQKLRRLEKECLADPRCTAEEIRKINDCINTLMKKQGRL